MEITGRVIKLLPMTTGKGKNGDWRKLDFILEKPGQYPKKVCISLWGDKIDQFGLQEGEEIKAMIDVESREYNGRWYTDVRAWKIEKGGAAANRSEEAGYVDIPAGEEEDDLPF